MDSYLFDVNLREFVHLSIINGNVMTDSNSVNNSKESIIEVPSNRIYTSLNDNGVGMIVSIGLREYYM